MSQTLHFLMQLSHFRPRHQAADGTGYLMHVSQSKSMAAGLEHACVGVLVKSRRIACAKYAGLARHRRSTEGSSLSCRRPTAPTTNFIGNKALRFDGMISLAQTRMPRLDARHFYILVIWIPCNTLANWRSFEGDMS